MMTGRLTRREFVDISLGALIAAPAALATSRMRLHLLLPPERGDLLNGVLLGVEEGRRTAALVGSELEAIRHEPGGETGPDAADDALAGIVAGVDRDLLARLVHRMRGVAPVLNAAAPDDALRSAHCGDALFHVAPSEAMLSRPPVPGDTPVARTVAWHPSLVRYGAKQLNDRYRARFPGAPGMSADAWCGWMAVKVLCEAALRSRARSSAELVAWMSSPRARFDGHKGTALTFDAQLQLRQPLYAVSNEGSVIAEVFSDARGATRCA